MSAIILEDIYKSWGSFQALANINFECEEGQLLVLLGPSGCGKSTTLRLICGLENPTSGIIRIGGRDVTQLPPVKRQISMVFQNYALFPHLDVAQNILFGLKARKVPVPEQKKRLENAAELLGLSKLLDRKSAQLSGGQRQRVALGRSIVAQVSVCLMDEPLSNLDAKLRQEMRQEIRFLQQRLKMTMVYVTHDQVEAMTIADKIILMKDGVIEQHGTPESLYNSPSTAFAGNFIGNPPMNILTPDPMVATFVSAMMKDREEMDDCLIGIRPENIEISSNTGIKARIKTIEYLGSDTLLVSTAGQQSITLTAPGKPDLSIGHEVYLTWKAVHTHVFDATTGNRLENRIKA